MPCVNGKASEKALSEEMILDTGVREPPYQQHLLMQINRQSSRSVAKRPGRIFPSGPDLDQSWMAAGLTDH